MPSLRPVPLVFPITGLPAALDVADLLLLPAFARASVVAGQDGVGRQVAHVNVMQVPTAAYARPAELILVATAALLDVPGGVLRLLRELAAKDVSALAIRGDTATLLGRRALGFADRADLPLIELPPSVPLNEMLTSVLERLVASQASQLQRVAAIRDELADYVLSGSELDQLPSAISRLTDGPVGLVDVTGRAVVTHPPDAVAEIGEVGQSWLAEHTREPLSFQHGWLAWPVLAGDRCLGALVASLPGQLDPIRLAPIRHGANYAALEMLQAQEADAAASRLRDRFIQDILWGGLDVPTARSRAEALDWDFDVPFRILVASNGGNLSELLHAIRLIHPDVLATERGRRCYAVLPEQVQLEQVSEAMQRPGTTWGRSGLHRTLEPITTALVEATEAWRAARAFPAMSVQPDFAELGPRRLLSLIPLEELHSFESRVLAPIDALGPATRASLVETLELLIDSNLNVAECSRRGSWHYNTVRYRLKRLTELLGPFIDDGTLLDSITLALLIRREASRQALTPSGRPELGLRGQHA